MIDEDKAIKFSNLPLSVMALVYIMAGLISHGGIYILYMNIMLRHNYGGTWYQKGVLILSLLFPAHFILMEAARCNLIHLKLSNQVLRLISEVKEGESKIQDLAAKYVSLRSEINENMKQLLSTQRSVIALSILEISIESLTQVIISITLLVSELQISSGKILNIITNTIFEFIGVDSFAICILMLIIIANNLSFGLLAIRNRNEPLLGHGILGTMMLIISITTMIGAKLFLLSTLFSNFSFAIPIIILAEIALTIGWFKTIGLKIDVLYNILPCSISPGLFLMPNEQTRIKISPKTMELLTILILHFLFLLFIYLPLYALIAYVPFLHVYRSIHDALIIQIAISVYIAAVFVYVALTLLYEKYGTPWRHLSICIQDNPTEINMEVMTTNDERNDGNGDNGEQQAGVKINKNMICTVTKSYMVENKAEIQQKISKNNKST